MHSTISQFILFAILISIVLTESRNLPDKPNSRNKRDDKSSLTLEDDVNEAHHRVKRHHHAKGFGSNLFTLNPGYSGRRDLLNPGFNSKMAMTNDGHMAALRYWGKLPANTITHGIPVNLFDGQ